MAHNLMQRNGKYAMAAARGVAVWHELGQRVGETATWREMAEAADLLWSIIVKDVYSRAPHTNEVIKLPDVRGVFRNDDGHYLGSVGSVWEPIQNSEAFEWVDTLLNCLGGAHYITAGALGQGEKVWTLAKVPFDFSVAEEADKVETYLLFTTAHDGTGAAKVKLVCTQVVCNNTLDVALAENGQEISIRHTKSAKERMDRAVKLMKGTQTSVTDLKDKLTALAERPLKRESVENIMDRLFPRVKDASGHEVDTTRRNNIVSGVLQCFESNNSNAFPSVAGTGYNLLNAVTEYTDHLRSARGSSKDDGAITKETKRAESAMFGSGSRLKQQALEIILEETQPAASALLMASAAIPVSAARR